MFGTVGLCKVKPENREALTAVLEKYADIKVPGYRGVELMFSENHEDTLVMVVWFEDADSYWKNAKDPEQDKRYQEYRVLMEEEPIWYDGEWTHGPWGKF